MSPRAAWRDGLAVAVTSLVLLLLAPLVGLAILVRRLASWRRRHAR